MRVNVTAKDIQEGIKQSCTSCPIARAISRLVDSGDKVEIFSDNAKIGEQSYPLPQCATDFIWRFDHYQSVWPLKFQLG